MAKPDIRTRRRIKLEMAAKAAIEARSQAVPETVTAKQARLFALGMPERADKPLTAHVRWEYRGNSNRQKPGRKL